MKKKLIVVAVYGLMFFITGCGKGGSNNPTPDPPNPCAGLSPKFAGDVQPIINATCATSPNCHARGSTNKGGPLTDYNKIFAKRSDIHTQVSTGLMPQSTTLTADQKNKIICWINSGAPDN